MEGNPGKQSTGASCRTVTALYRINNEYGLSPNCRICDHRAATQVPGPPRSSTRSPGCSRSQRTRCPSNSLFSSAFVRSVGRTSRRPDGPTAGLNPLRKTRGRIGSGSSSSLNHVANYRATIDLSQSRRSSGRTTNIHSAIAILKDEELIRPSKWLMQPPPNPEAPIGTKCGFHQWASIAGAA